MKTFTLETITSPYAIEYSPECVVPLGAFCKARGLDYDEMCYLMQNGLTWKLLPLVFGGDEFGGIGHWKEQIGALRLHHNPGNTLLLRRIEVDMPVDDDPVWDGDSVGYVNAITPDEFAPIIGDAGAYYDAQ